MSEVYLFFGRANPPTIAHQRIIKEFNEKGDLKVYLSKKEGDKKNPLPYDWKVDLCEEAFGVPVETSSARNPLEALTELSDQGYTDVTVILGEDRFDMRNRIMLYNGSLYNFDSINFESTGDRKDGVSSTALRRELKESTKSDILPVELWKYSELISDWINEDLGAQFRMVKVDTPNGPIWRKQRLPLKANTPDSGKDSQSTADDTV